MFGLALLGSSLQIFELYVLGREQSLGLCTTYFIAMRFTILDLSYAVTILLYSTERDIPLRPGRNANE
jgi:hypothetical protein